ARAHRLIVQVPPEQAAVEGDPGFLIGGGELRPRECPWSVRGEVSHGVSPLVVAARAPRSQYSAMVLRRTCMALVAAAVATALARPAAQPQRPIAVDDLMKLRSI